MYCFLDSPHVGYFKSVISTTLRMTVTISLLNIHYTVILREIDLNTIIKENKNKLCTKGWKFMRILFLFTDRWLSRIKRKLGTREKNTYAVYKSDKNKPCQKIQWSKEKGQQHIQWLAMQSLHRKLKIEQYELH